MSRVDVVIPCYKYAHYLRDCVNSVLTQDAVDVRVLIIDDCSPDETPEVGRKLAAEDPRVEYRRHEVNRGHIATYNEGLLGWASDDYCLLLSADDHLRAGALSRAVRIMDADASVVMTYGRDIVQRSGEELNEDGLPARIVSSGSDVLPSGIGRQPLGGALVMDGDAFLELCCEACDNPVPTPTAVVRTSAQHKVGGYRADLPHSGDMEMWMRLAAVGRIGFVDAFQAYYRWHGRNMQNCYTGSAAFKDLEQRLKAMRTMMDTAGRNLPQRGKLMARASRRIASCAIERANRSFDEGDTSGADACIRFATETDPEVLGSKAFAKLKWKRRLGVAGTNLLRRMYRPLGARLITADHA